MTKKKKTEKKTTTVPKSIKQYAAWPEVLLNDGGYPTAGALRYISKFPITHRPTFELFALIASIWHWGVKPERKKRGEDTVMFKLITGGWSGNESIIGALEENRLFWCMCHTAWERGGLFKFEVPGYMWRGEFKREEKK
jgi:hypothetical protein